MRIHDGGRACHPKVRASTLRSYMLDEPVAGSAYDVARGKVAAYAGFATIPDVIYGPTPFARRWTTGASGPLREAAADPEVTDAALRDWTVHILARRRFSTGGPACLFAISGASGDVDGSENVLVGIYITNSGALTVEWEHSVGTNVLHTFAAGVPLYEWCFLTLRKRDTTAAGPGGTTVVDLFVNGTLVGDTGTITNAGNPVSSAAWLQMGSLQTTTPAAFYMASIDIAHVSFHEEVLSVEEIEEDARRVKLLPFFTRCDLSVTVEDSEGRTVDLCDLDGRDAVHSVDIENDNDAASTTARITLQREEGELSLAGLRTDAKWNLSDKLDPTSYSALLREGSTPIEVRVGRVPLGLRATQRDLFSAFSGFVDEIDDGNNSNVIVSCRDRAALLIDTFIEEEVNYSAPDSVFAVEGEMQYILNDNDNDAGNDSVAGLATRSGSYSPLTLYTPVSPSWSVRGWRQRREPVLSALRTLAGQIGWDARYRFDQNPDVQDWRLTFYEPPRGKLFADVVLTADEIVGVTRLARSIFNVRNVVRVVYPSAETTLPTTPTATGYVITSGWSDVDGEGQRLAAWVQVESTASIALFGRRMFCEFAEEGTSQIDTISEAFDMAFGAVRDLEEPQLDKAIRVSALPELDVHDVVNVRPIQQLFTAAQTLAVARVTHSFAETSETRLELRGKPALGYKRWLALEARPGNAKPAVISPLDALTDVRPGTLLSTVRNVLDRTSLFTGGKYLSIRNPDFGAFSAGFENPPDGWSMKTGTWVVDCDVIVGSSLSGGKCIRLKTSTAEIRSDFVPILGSYDFPYSFEVVWQWPSGSPGATTKRVELLVEWYDGTKTLISSSVIRVGGTSALYPPFQFPDVTVAAGVWYTSRVDGVSPPPAGTARFVKLTVRPSTDGGHSMLAQGIYVDTVSAYRTAREDKTFLLNNFTISGGSTGANAWYCINLRSAAGSSGSPPPFDSHDWGHNHFIYSGGADVIPREDGTDESFGATFRGAGFYCKEDGTYLVTATTTLLWNTTGTPPNPLARLVKNATYTSSTNPLNTGGTVVAQAVGSTWTTLTNYNNGSAVAGFTNAQVSTVTITTRVTLLRGDRLTFEYQRGIASAVIIQPVTGSEIGNYQQLNWWCVRLALAE